MSIEDEIKAMNELSTRAPGTSSPSTSSPSTSSPSTEAPSTEAPTTEAPVDKYAELYAKITELESKLVSKEKVSTTAPSTDAPIEGQDFLALFGDEDPYEIVSDKVKFNKLLNAVYEAGVKTARSQTSESVFRKIPAMVKANTQTYVVMAEAGRQFYKDNEDLVPHAKKVAEIFESMIGKNPEKPFEEVMSELGNEARKVLNLQRKAQTSVTKPSLPPGTKGGKQQSGTKKLTGIMAEIEAMNAIGD